jgi:hypothetical protein
MSLSVPADIVAKAENGSLQESDFVAVVKESLPDAWAIVANLVQQLDKASSRLVSFGEGPMDEKVRGQLLRMLAGTAIRTAVERHFGVKLLFQNCHNPAVVREEDENSKEAKEFVSPESQVKNQKPEYQHC